MVRSGVAVHDDISPLSLSGSPSLPPSPSSPRSHRILGVCRPPQSFKSAYTSIPFLNKRAGTWSHVSCFKCPDLLPCLPWPPSLCDSLPTSPLPQVLVPIIYPSLLRSLYLPAKWRRHHLAHTTTPNPSAPCSTSLLRARQVTKVRYGTYLAEVGY